MQGDFSRCWRSRWLTSAVYEERTGKNTRALASLAGPGLELLRCHSRPWRHATSLAFVRAHHGSAWESTRRLRHPPRAVQENESSKLGTALSISHHLSTVDIENFVSSRLRAGTRGGSSPADGSLASYRAIINGKLKAGLVAPVHPLSEDPEFAQQ